MGEKIQDSESEEHEAFKGKKEVSRADIPSFNDENDSNDNLEGRGDDDCD